MSRTKVLRRTAPTSSSTSILPWWNTVTVLAIERMNCISCSTTISEAVRFTSRINPADLTARLDVCQGELYEYGLDDYLQVAIDALKQGWDELGLEDVLSAGAAPGRSLAKATGPPAG